MPGTSELFTLKRYQEELGKDCNRIYLYLRTNEDYNNTVMSGDDSEDDSMPRLPKCSKLVGDSEDDRMSHLPKCSKLESVPVVTIPE